MSNKLTKKFKNKSEDFIYYKSIIPKHYHQYYDDITSLYINRYIESKATVDKMLNILSNKRNFKVVPKKIQSVLDYVDSTKYRQDEDQPDIKFVPLQYHEPISGIKEKKEVRDFFISVEIKRYTRYLAQKRINGKLKKIIIMMN